MHAAYKIYVEKELIVYRIDGTPEIDSVISLWTRFAQDPQYRSTFRGIADWRNAKGGLTRTDIRTMADYVTHSDITYANWVVLVTEPMLTAFAMIYGDMVKMQHRQHVCCTVERSSEILGFDTEPYLL